MNCSLSLILCAGHQSSLPGPAQRRGSSPAEGGALAGGSPGDRVPSGVWSHSQRSVKCLVCCCNVCVAVHWTGSGCRSTGMCCNGQGQGAGRLACAGVTALCYIEQGQGASQLACATLNRVRVQVNWHVLHWTGSGCKSAGMCYIEQGQGAGRLACACATLNRVRVQVSWHVLHWTGSGCRLTGMWSYSAVLHLTVSGCRSTGMCYIGQGQGAGRLACAGVTALCYIGQGQGASQLACATLNRVRVQVNWHVLHWTVSGCRLTGMC